MIRSYLPTCKHLRDFSLLRIIISTRPLQVLATFPRGGSSFTKWALTWSARSRGGRPFLPALSAGRRGAQHVPAL